MRLISSAVHAAVVSLMFAEIASAQVAARTFDSYEAIRVALSADRLEGVATQSKELVPLAAEIAGPDARAAAERLGAAADLKAARDAFGVLSKLLVPKFVEAKLPGVHAFECSMVKLPWAQRGDKVENPYMGKAMSSCGNPWKPKG